jgi:hypothetical protein
MELLSAAADMAFAHEGWAWCILFWIAFVMVVIVAPIALVGWIDRLTSREHWARA